MRKYITNPFILIGTVGVIFYIWQRKKVLKNLPTYKKGKLDIGTNNLSPENDLPEEFVNDVKKMSKEKILRTISHNDKMLERAKMSDKKRAGMERMLDFLTDEYQSRD